jgi:hypothetical protein
MTQALKVIFAMHKFASFVAESFSGLASFANSPASLSYSPTHCTGLHFDQMEAGHEE